MVKYKHVSDVLDTAFLVTSSYAPLFLDQWETMQVCACHHFFNWHGVSITHKIHLRCIYFSMYDGPVITCSENRLCQCQGRWCERVAAWHMSGSFCHPVFMLFLILERGEEVHCARSVAVMSMDPVTFHTRIQSCGPLHSVWISK
jgi:hypothetical protein